MKLQALFRREQQSFLPEDLFGRIREERAFAEECGFDPEQLHCKGCIYSCPLSRVKCDTGKETLPFLEKCRADS